MASSLLKKELAIYFICLYPTDLFQELIVLKLLDELSFQENSCS